MAATDDAVQVSLHQLQVPVLKGKQRNPVLQIKMTIPKDTAPRRVESMTISTKGTDDLADIKAVRLFYLGQDPFFVRYEVPLERAGGIVDILYDQKVVTAQLGGDKPPSASITFKANQSLAPGENFFWVTYELTDEADLHHKVDAGRPRQPAVGAAHRRRRPATQGRQRGHLQSAGTGHNRTGDPPGGL